MPMFTEDPGKSASKEESQTHSVEHLLSVTGWHDPRVSESSGSEGHKLSASFHRYPSIYTIIRNGII